MAGKDPGVTKVQVKVFISHKTGRRSGSLIIRMQKGSQVYWGVTAKSCQKQAGAKKTGTQANNQTLEWRQEGHTIWQGAVLSPAFK